MGVSVGVVGSLLGSAWRLSLATDREADLRESWSDSIEILGRSTSMHRHECSVQAKFMTLKPHHLSTHYHEPETAAPLA